MKKKYMKPTADIYVFEAENITADPIAVSNVKADLENEDSFLTLDGKNGRALKRIIALKW